MAIHHDKLAYGKLAKTSEELSEEKLLAMLKKLNEEQENEEPCENKEGAKNKQSGQNS